MQKAENAKQMPRNWKPRTGKHDIAPKMRKTFLRALDEVARRQDKAIHEVMADWLEADPYRMIQAISKFSVRHKEFEVKHDHRVAHEPVADTLAWIEEMLGESETGGTEKPSTH